MWFAIRLSLIGLVCCSWFGTVASTSAQEFGFGDLGSFPGADAGEPVEFSAEFKINEGKRDGVLQISATLADPWYIYSVTQPPGGPLKTRIDLKSADAKVTGPFQSDKAPKIVKSEVFKGIPIEEHFEKVTWSAPIELAEGVDAEKVKLTVIVNGQTCIENGSCKPINDEEVAVKFSGFIKSAVVDAANGPYRDEASHVGWTVEIKPAALPPGGKGEIVITGIPDSGYHLYPLLPKDDETDFRTLLVIDQKGELQFAEPKPDSLPVEETLVPGQPPISYHKGTVKWSVPFTVPGNATEGKRLLSGYIGFQACDDKSCDQPLGFKFNGELVVDSNTGGGAAGVFALSKAEFAEVADHPQRMSWLENQTGADGNGVAGGSRVDETKEEQDVVAAMSLGTWFTYVGMALIGGFILNFMPCVLPVIGLKLMGFAQKGKQDVQRIEVLDLWFIVGILSVLWALAGISILANVWFERQFNWGEQFTITEFKVTLTVIVFAMALSFLGVWEIPIPGFAATKKSGELMEQEGPVGAFFKGFFTTLLATPCSGPFLGVVFGACIGQSSLVVFSLFTAIGLGLASPYIAIAISPKLLFWLPKPGPWMNTLKEIMAFPLLFTVVFLVSTVNRDFRIATLALLMVVWLACWIIGKVPGYAPLLSRAKAWVSGAALTAVGAWAFFTYLGPIDKHIDWQPYNESRLSQLRSEGKTVLIDFTADWCLTCKTNLAFAIETENVSTLIKENKVVPLLADWTDPSDEIKKKLAELKSASIPVLAIYPPDSKPIVLRDLVSEADVLNALKQAGPSRPANSQAGAKTSDRMSNERANAASAIVFGSN